MSIGTFEPAKQRVSAIIERYRAMAPCRSGRTPRSPETDHGDHPMQPDVLTPSELADCLGGVTPETVLKWAREGRVPCLRPSRKVVLFILADVLEALEGQNAEGANRA